MPQPLRIATRRSKLALWQAEHVAALLRAAHPRLAGRTGADEHAGRSRAGPRARRGRRQGSVRQGTRGRDAGRPRRHRRALDEGRAERTAARLLHRRRPAARQPAGRLHLAAIRALRRSAARRARRHVEPAPAGAAARARAPTWSSNCCAATWTPACAGSRKAASTRSCSPAPGSSDWGSARASRKCSTSTCRVPAVGQGVIGIECREDDARSREPAGCAAPRRFVRAARARNARSRATLDGSCHSPIAAHATLDGSDAHAARLRRRARWPRGVP